MNELRRAWSVVTVRPLDAEACTGPAAPRFRGSPSRRLVEVEVDPRWRDQVVLRLIATDRVAQGGIHLAVGSPP